MIEVILQYFFMAEKCVRPKIVFIHWIYLLDHILKTNHEIIKHDRYTNSVGDSLIIGLCKDCRLYFKKNNRFWIEDIKCIAPFEYKGFAIVVCSIFAWLCFWFCFPFSMFSLYSHRCWQVCSCFCRSAQRSVRRLRWPLWSLSAEWQFSYSRVITATSQIWASDQSRPKVWFVSWWCFQLCSLFAKCFFFT